MADEAHRSQYGFAAKIDPKTGEIRYGFAHHLRRAGYHTCLSGKMHFVGPDQLHGFEERLTTDIYPADFGWTPDYRKPGERIDWW